LDIGCGSGVLTLGAARVGVARLVGVDNDPIAVEVSRDNAAINGVDAEFTTTPAGAVPGQFPLVVANIISSILLHLRDDITARVAPGGWLILSGVLASEAASVGDAYAEGSQLWVERIDTLGEWSAIWLQSRSAS